MDHSVILRFFPVRSLLRPDRIPRYGQRRRIFVHLELYRGFDDYGIRLPSSKIESGKAITEIESFEAPSIAEAIRRLKSLVDKELDFGHCRVILLGKSLAENEVETSLNWLARRKDNAMVSFVAMAEPSAFDVPKLHPLSERYPGNALLLSFGSEGTESSFTVSEYLFDFLRRQKETGKDGYLPVIRRDADGNSYQVFRAAFFDKQKLRLSLAPEETQLLNLSAKRQQELNEQMERLLYKIRDSGVDPYGFGLRYLARSFGQTKEWDAWKQAYPHVGFRVDSKIVIDKASLIK